MKDYKSEKYVLSTFIIIYFITKISSKISNIRIRFSKDLDQDLVLNLILYSYK